MRLKAQTQTKVTTTCTTTSYFLRRPHARDLISPVSILVAVSLSANSTNWTRSLVSLNTPCRYWRLELDGRVAVHELAAKVVLEKLATRARIILDDFVPYQSQVWRPIFSLSDLQEQTFSSQWLAIPSLGLSTFSLRMSDLVTVPRPSTSCLKNFFSYY